MKPAPSVVAALWIVVLALALIGLSAAGTRTYLLLTDAVSAEALSQRLFDPALKHRLPGAAPIRREDMEARYFQHPAMVLAHVIPGLIFMILGPLQFVRGLRSRNIRLHRWSGRVYLLAAGWIGISGLILGWRIPLGGASETTAITLFGSLYLCELTMAFRHVLRGEIAQHREWMIRAFILGLGIATDRPVVGLFFAFSKMPLSEFFAIALWLSFTIHLIGAEVWINLTRPAR